MRLSGCLSKSIMAYIGQTKLISVTHLLKESNKRQTILNYMVPVIVKMLDLIAIIILVLFVAFIGQEKLLDNAHLFSK